MMNGVIFGLYISQAWKTIWCLKKTATSQTHFGFTNLGSEHHQLSATAIWNQKISNETPCIQMIIMIGMTIRAAKHKKPAPVIPKGPMYHESLSDIDGVVKVEEDIEM